MTQNGIKKNFGLFILLRPQFEDSPNYSIGSQKPSRSLVWRLFTKVWTSLAHSLLCQLSTGQRDVAAIADFLAKIDWALKLQSMIHTQKTKNR